MPDQMELFAPARAPAIDQEDVDRVISFLEAADDWITADNLLRWLGMPITEAGRRRLRAIAEASGGLIASGPGTPGYILTKSIKPEDLHLVEGLRSQSQRMLQRYLNIMRVWHKNIISRTSEN